MVTEQNLACAGLSVATDMTVEKTSTPQRPASEANDGADFDA